MSRNLTAIFLMSVLMLVSGGIANAGIADERVTAEVILDGMTHFEADQGLKDYKAGILEITEETSRPGVVQVEKEIYFMAPNVLLTMVNGEPKSYSDDKSFQVFLSMMDLERKDDEEIRGEACFVVVATPRDPALKKYTKTYYVAKSDFRKIRIVSVRSEMSIQFVTYIIDFNYNDFADGGKKYSLVKSSEAVAHDGDGVELLTQTNLFRDYEFNIGLTQKFFDKILEDYKTYFTEGS